MATGERRIGSTRRGMTVLGKIPTVPKPINLPSQKLENRGLDASVEIVPRGTFSWGAGKSPPTSDSPRGNAALASSAPVTTGAWNAVSNPQTISNSANTAAGIVQNSSRPSSAGSSRPSSAHAITSRAWVSAAKEEQLQPSCFAFTSVDFPTLGSEKNLNLHAQHGNTTSSRPTSADTTQSRHSVISETSLNRPTSADGTKERQSAYLDGRLHSDQVSSADESISDDIVCDSAGSSRPGPGLNVPIEVNYTVYPFARGILLPAHGFMLGPGAYPGASFHPASVPQTKLEDKGLSWNGAIYGGYPPNVVPQPFFTRPREYGIHHPSHQYSPLSSIRYAMQSNSMGNVPLHDQAARGMEKAQYYCLREHCVEQKDRWDEQGRDQTLTDVKPSVSFEKIQMRKRFNNTGPLQNHENGHISVDSSPRNIAVAELSPKVSSPMHGCVTVMDEVPDEKMCIDGNRRSKGQNLSKQALAKRADHNKKDSLDGDVLQQDLKLSHEVVSRNDLCMDATIETEKKNSAATAKNIRGALYDKKASDLSEQNSFLDHSSKHYNSTLTRKANTEKRNSAISACSPSIDSIPIINEHPCGAHQEEHSTSEAYEERENDMSLIGSDMAIGIGNSSINSVNEIQVLDCNKKEGSLNVKEKSRQFWKTARGAKKGMRSRSSQDNEEMKLENHMLEKNAPYPGNYSLSCGNQVDDARFPEGGNVSREDVTSMEKLSLEDSSSSLPGKEKTQVGIRRKVKRKGRISRHSQRDQLHESHAWTPVKGFVPVNEMEDCYQCEDIELKGKLPESSRNQIQHQQQNSAVNNNIHNQEGLKSSGTKLEEQNTDRKHDPSIQTQSVLLHTDQQDARTNDSENIANSKRRHRNWSQQEAMDTHDEREQWVQKNILARRNRQERKQWQETAIKASKNIYKMQEGDIVQEKCNSSLAQDTLASAKTKEKIIFDTVHLKAAEQLRNHHQEASKFQQARPEEHIKQGQNKASLKEQGNISFLTTKSVSQVSDSISTKTSSKETGGRLDDRTLVSEEMSTEDSSLYSRKHSLQKSLRKQLIHVSNDPSEIRSQKQDLKNTEQYIQSEFLSDITGSNKKAESKMGTKKPAMHEVTQKSHSAIFHDTKEVAKGCSDNVNGNTKMGSYTVNLTAENIVQQHIEPVSVRQKGKQQQRFDVEHQKRITQAFICSESDKDRPSSGDKSVDNEASAKRGNRTSRNRRGKKRNETKPYVPKCQQTHYGNCDDNGVEVQGIVTMSEEQSIFGEVKIVGSGQVSGRLHDFSEAHKFSCQVSFDQPAVDSGRGKVLGWEPKDGQQASSGKPFDHTQKHVRTKITDSSLNRTSAGTQRWQPRHSQDQKSDKA